MTLFPLLMRVLVCARVTEKAAPWPTPMKAAAQSVWNTLNDLKTQLEQQKKFKNQAPSEERMIDWQPFREGLGPGAATDAVPGCQEKGIGRTKCSKRSANQNFISVFEGFELVLLESHL